MFSAFSASHLQEAAFSFDRFLNACSQNICLQMTFKMDEPGNVALDNEEDVEDKKKKEEEEEEEASEADSTSVDFDARAYGIYQQLPVGMEEPDFASGSPQTAEEYLRRVR